MLHKSFIPTRKHIRLTNFDYSQSASYFITMCCNERARLFGAIENGSMMLNENGKVIEDSWLWLQKHYSYVVLDEFVVMPDHFHGIISITRNSELNDLQQTHVKPLGQLIGAFKTVSSKKIHCSTSRSEIRIWQRNYWERIVRTEYELNAVRQYIRNNPKNWTP